MASKKEVVFRWSLLIWGILVLVVTMTVGTFDHSVDGQWTLIAFFSSLASYIPVFIVLHCREIDEWLKRQVEE